ncbi:MAG: iron ABC transporter permease [Ruminococcaceae bacterium]|nr:iron ABC transporter permease [Oscillospiraceae bacterium]
MRNNAVRKPFFQSPKCFFMLLAGLFVAALLSLYLGNVKMSFQTFFSALFGFSNDKTATLILYAVRLPRVVACILCGIGLSVSGVLLQTVTDNPLAGPSLIGVNQGAGFFSVLLLTLFPMWGEWMPLVSFFGAFLVTCLILAISRAMGDAKGSFVLAGIALGALFSAFISFFTLMNDDVMASYHGFSVGSCAVSSLRVLAFPAVMIGFGLLFALLFSKPINALALGNLTAASLGVRVRRIRLLAVLCASACAAAVVSFAGLLGFVGLVVPNFARKLTGNHTAYLLGVSALLGAILVLLADLLGRLLLAPTEIPVGIMMACIGAPFFLSVLLQKRFQGDSI